MRFGNDEFEGPYRSAAETRNLAGLILVRTPRGVVVDIITTPSVSISLSDAENIARWKSTAAENHCEYWVYYTPYMSPIARLEIAGELRRLLRPLTPVATVSA